MVQNREDKILQTKNTSLYNASLTYSSVIVFVANASTSSHFRLGSIFLSDMRWVMQSVLVSLNGLEFPWDVFVSKVQAYSFFCFKDNLVQINVFFVCLPWCGKDFTPVKMNYKINWNTPVNKEGVKFTPGKNLCYKGYLFRFLFSLGGMIAYNIAR